MMMAICFDGPSMPAMTKHGSQCLLPVVKHMAFMSICGDERFKCLAREGLELCRRLVIFSEGLPHEAHDAAKTERDAAGRYTTIYYLQLKHGAPYLQMHFNRFVYITQIGSKWHALQQRPGEAEQLQHEIDDLFDKLFAQTRWIARKHKTNHLRLV